MHLKSNKLRTVNLCNKITLSNNLYASVPEGMLYEQRIYAKMLLACVAHIDDYLSVEVGCMK